MVVDAALIAAGARRNEEQGRGFCHVCCPRAREYAASIAHALTGWRGFLPGMMTA